MCSCRPGRCWYVETRGLTSGPSSWMSHGCSGPSLDPGHRTGSLTVEAACWGLEAPSKACNKRMINPRKVESRPKYRRACALCAAVDGKVKFKWGGNVVTELHYLLLLTLIPLAPVTHFRPPALPQEESSRGCLFTAAEEYITSSYAALYHARYRTHRRTLVSIPQGGYSLKRGLSINQYVSRAQT